jgi:hypothetical protein
MKRSTSSTIAFLTALTALHATPCTGSNQHVPIRILAVVETTVCDANQLSKHQTYAQQLQQLPVGQRKSLPQSTISTTLLDHNNNNNNYKSNNQHRRRQFGIVSLRGGGSNDDDDRIRHHEIESATSSTSTTASTTRYTVLSEPAPGCPFHYAFPVHDLEVAKHFYGTILGCNEGRSSEKWQDYSLHGHQIVCHWVGNDYRCHDYYNPVDGDDVPVPRTFYPIEQKKKKHPIYIHISILLYNTFVCNTILCCSYRPFCHARTHAF